MRLLDQPVDQDPDCPKSRRTWTSYGLMRRVLHLTRGKPQVFPWSFNNSLGSGQSQSALPAGLPEADAPYAACCLDTTRYALCGDLGSQFMLDEWGYPAIGVVIADCPSAGHNLMMLDYRACGLQGEPTVVHIDQENDYQLVTLALNFEAFVRGLRPELEFKQ